MWPLHVYTRKKRAGQRLNVTPTPDPGVSAMADAPLGGKEKGQAQGLPKIAEKAERSKQGGSGSGPPSTQLIVTGERGLQENSASEETQDEKMASVSESVTDDPLIGSSSSNSGLVSGLNLQHISSSLLSYSVTDSSSEYESYEESLSSFPSPELFRGSDYLDWECPKLKEHMHYKNSTLLDTSKAAAIEKVPQFSNISAILSASSEDYQKCHRKIVMTSADQKISPGPNYTTNSEPDNTACEVLLDQKTFPSIAEKTKKKFKEDSEHRDTNFQSKLNSHLKIKVPSSHRSSAHKRDAGRSNKVPPCQPLEPALKTNSSTPDKKSRGLLTSTPSSETAGFVIDLSSVQKASLEELFPNVSNYVNSNEIVPVSSLQEDSSNEFPSNASEICCIIRASPGTRQVKSKGVIVKKKKYSPPKDIPQVYHRELPHVNTSIGCEKEGKVVRVGAVSMWAASHITRAFRAYSVYLNSSLEFCVTGNSTTKIQNQYHRPIRPILGKTDSTLDFLAQDVGKSPESCLERTGFNCNQEYEYKGRAGGGRYYNKNKWQNVTAVAEFSLFGRHECEVKVHKAERLPEIV
ncbi:meiosis-specific kinetochore protein [Tupaia chinensis]|uniref:meiosis-specific kinetochore protein n=1 Tax=Tupaia chinensis TaxID=246437 RepID=UPI000FFBC9BC|nr:meiosis-specific kinetochore protein [Tupaia chinensis]